MSEGILTFSCKEQVQVWGLRDQGLAFMVEGSQPKRRSVWRTSD